VGQAVARLDPRRAQDLYITTLESLSVCPWRTFLERLLHLEARPDPTEVLPGLDPLLIGQLVHRVLERLVDEHLPSRPSTVKDLRAAEAVDVPWPEEDRLWSIVRREATWVAHAQGISWEGFVNVLAQITLPFLEKARELLWHGVDELRPVAVEMDCSMPIESGPADRRLHFKADRVDNSMGRLVLSDYKTGRSGVSNAKKRATQDKHLLAKIRTGRLLQAAAYARASGGPEDLGRYVFLHPEFKGSEETRVVSVTLDNKAILSAFDHAIQVLLQAWNAGIFFPRLVEPDKDEEPAACDSCGVAEACLRHDSSARGRLRDWFARNQPQSDLEEAVLDSWFLASKKETQA
jgi:RecB family exonuclease